MSLQFIWFALRLMLEAAQPRFRKFVQTLEAVPPRFRKFVQTLEDDHACIEEKLGKRNFTSIKATLSLVVGMEAVVMFALIGFEVIPNEDFAVAILFPLGAIYGMSVLYAVKKIPEIQRLNPDQAETRSATPAVVHADPALSQS